MKSIFFNRNSLLFSCLLTTALGLNAQITSTHTDEKFGYTTVVYKDTLATDAAVLAALENSIGMGDVVRVTVAPPKPKAIPTIDKSKGEDIWLKPNTTRINNLTAGTSAVMINNSAAKASAPTAPVAIVAKAAPVASKPLIKTAVNAPKPVSVEAPHQAVEKVVAAPKTVKSVSTGVAKTSKSSKSTVKKSGKKSGGSFKMKNRKKGKQRYGCPKF